MLIAVVDFRRPLLAGLFASRENTMKVEEVRQRARQVGIVTTGKMPKAVLVRAIQAAEGNQECFGADGRLGCDQPGCCWRADCLAGKR